MNEKILAFGVSLGLGLGSLVAAPGVKLEQGGEAVIETGVLPENELALEIERDFAEVRDFTDRVADGTEELNEVLRDCGNTIADSVAAAPTGSASGKYDKGSMRTAVDCVSRITKAAQPLSEVVAEGVPVFDKIDDVIDRIRNNSEGRMATWGRRASKASQLADRIEEQLDRMPALSEIEEGSPLFVLRDELEVKAMKLRAIAQQNESARMRQAPHLERVLAGATAMQRVRQALPQIQARARAVDEIARNKARILIKETETGAEIEVVELVEIFTQTVSGALESLRVTVFNFFGFSETDNGAEEASGGAD